MGVETAPRTFADLYTELLSQVFENPANTSAVTKAKRAINVALHDIAVGTDYAVVWPNRHAFVKTRPNTSHTVITATLDRGDVNLVLSGAEVLDDFGDKAIRLGGKLILPGSDVIHEVIDLVGGGTDIVTYTPAFAGADQGLGGTVTYFEDEYDLAPDFLRPVDVTRFSFGSTPIALIGKVDFQRAYPRNRTFSRPIVATIVDRGTGEMGITTGATRRIRFWRAPSQYDQIHYSYITSDVVQDATGAVVGSQLVSDTDEPIMPERYRYAIVLHALARWLRKTDDARSREVDAEYNEFMGRILSDTEVGQSRPRLQPNRSAAIAGRTPWHGSVGGRFDLHGEFDHIRRWNRRR